MFRFVRRCEEFMGSVEGFYYFFLRCVLESGVERIFGVFDYVDVKLLMVVINRELLN